jgi:rod shape-determining protein MreB
MYLPFSINKRQSIAIDLGNHKTIVTDSDGMLASQPSWIALHLSNRSVKAVGERAYEIFGKATDTVTAIKPLRGGVIADFTSANMMLKAFVGEACRGRRNLMGYHNIISGVPFFTTEVERNAVRDSLQQFHARNRYLLFEPLAAAIGLGLNIHEPKGRLILDIGGGITEIVVISLTGIVTSNSIRVAGDAMDEAIQDYLRRRYNLAVGIRTAEMLKIRLGSVSADIPVVPAPVQVQGKDIYHGLPAMQEICCGELVEVLEKPMSRIADILLKTLQNCPPDLASDIYRDGIYITGGSSQLRGVKERLSRITGLPVNVDPTPTMTVGRGIRTVLRDMENYRSVLVE